MAATATFKLDFTQWDSALKAARENMKDFENVGKSAARQFAQLARSFSGAQIQKEAKATAAAIEAIGGASKLTASEQRRASASIDEAIAKYRALGQVAPAALVDIQAELKKVTAAEHDMSAGIDKTALKSLQGFKDGADEASGSMSLLGTGMKLAFGGAVLGGILAAGKSVLDFGGHLTDLSQTTGIATDDLQTLGVVGRRVGLSMDDIAQAVTQMSKRLAGGDQSAAGAVQSLGLNVSQLIAMAPDKAFERIAAAIGEVENPMERTRLATELLGKAGAQALPLMTAELGKMRDAAKESGQVIDAETVKAMDDLGDAWEDMKTVGSVLLANVMRPMIPVLHGLAEGATKASGAFSRDWAEQTTILSDAWTKLKATLQDIPGAWNNLVNMAHGGQDFGALAGGLNATAAATGALATAQKGSITTTDLANNRLKALREEAMAPLTAEQKRLIVELDKFGQSNQDIAQTVGSNAIAVKLYLDMVKKAGQEAEAAAKKQKELNDQLSGKEAIDGLRRLNAAWNAVSPAIRNTTAAQAVFLDEWDKIGPKLSHVPSDLAAVVRGFNAMSAAAGRFSGQKISSGLKSLEGIGVEIKDTFTNVFADMLEFETKITPTTRNINALISSAFKFDDRLETNFINTVTDLQDRLTVVNKRGLDRQLAELQISKRKELASIRANNQLTEEEYLKLASIVEGIYKQMADEIVRKSSFAGRIKAAFKDIATDLPNILLGAFTGELRGEQLGKALGASIGAAIGAAFGGVIGAAVGGAIGQGIAEMFSTKAEQTARRVARLFGANIGEEMGQAIVDRAKLMFQGNQAAAQIFSLPDVIQAAGGLNAFNIGPMFDRLHDVFTMIQTGAFSAAQGMEVLDKTFKQFADFVTDRGTLASKQLLDIIKLNEQYSTSSKAVAEFVTAQITGAFTGLTTFLDNAKVSSNEAASSISAAIFGAFEALQKQGASPLDAFNAIAPALEKLDAQLKATGLSGGAAFQTMMQYAAIAKDAVAGPLLTAIAGLNDALHGLHNAGVLNQEMFGGLAKQVSDTYNQLVLAGKGGQQALQLIAPTLQTLWEEMTDFGYVVDDATKALIDQGVAAGVVGDKQRSAQDKMLKAVERTADAVEALANLFGATLPSDIQKTADAINKIPRNVNIGVHYTDSGFTPQPGEPTTGAGTKPLGHAAGGVFDRPHLAYVAEGGQPEMIGSVGFMTRALEGALTRVQTAGGAVTVIPVVIQGSASPDDADAILAALVRAEPRITGNAGGVRSALLRALGR